ncbi:ABC transporter permease [Marmoricola endophyticus]|uniref:ABC transporter permease n=1 Tax=Marmoricola endophyticus TaxID=2040280 RepID=A0A917F1V6_9ACTN|nr:ABC transporter permease [Marmoricola endophyticus]GGF44761.1 ABC transporter permease [Marmoricola endophyticus]
MSLDTASSIDSAKGAAGAQMSRRSTREGRAVLTWTDLVVPVIVVLVGVVVFVYVHQQSLDTIESNILNTETLTKYTVQHVYISLSIAVLVMLIAVPLGVLVTRRRTRWLAPFVLAAGNVGQSAPSLGLLALVGIYAIGFWAVVWILTAYSALSVLRNTIVGLEGIDPGVLDACRGMGMSPLAILLRVELPLAVPVIGAGARTALVLAVGTVPLGYALNAGGLGLPLFSAIKTNRPVATLTIAVMIALLALTMDWLAGLLQRTSTPRGIR